MREGVKLKRTHEEEVPDLGPEGLSDGGHVLLTCSNCRAALMDAWVTRPHEQQTWPLQASCPFCGDASFVVEVKGGFHYGGFSLPNEDDANDDRPITKVESFEIKDGTFHFKIVKAHPDAKPVRR